MSCGKSEGVDCPPVPDSRKAAKRLEQRLDSKILEGRLAIRSELRKLVTDEEEASLAGATEKQEAIARFMAETIRGLPPTISLESLRATFGVGVFELAPEFAQPRNGFVGRMRVLADLRLSWDDLLNWATPDTESTSGIWKPLSIDDDPSYATIEDVILVYFGRGRRLSRDITDGWIREQRKQLGWAPAHVPMRVVGFAPDLVAQLAKCGGCKETAIGVFTREQQLFELAGHQLVASTYSYIHESGKRESDILAFDKDYCGNYLAAFMKAKY